jgi:hypothetical protein
MPKANKIKSRAGCSLLEQIQEETVPQTDNSLLERIQGLKPNSLLSQMHLLDCQRSQKSFVNARNLSTNSSQVKSAELMPSFLSQMQSLIPSLLEDLASQLSKPTWDTLMPINETPSLQLQEDMSLVNIHPLDPYDKSILEARSLELPTSKKKSLFSRIDLNEREANPKSWKLMERNKRLTKHIFHGSSMILFMNHNSPQSSRRPAKCSSISPLIPNTSFQPSLIPLIISHSLSQNGLRLSKVKPSISIRSSQASTLSPMTIDRLSPSEMTSSFNSDIQSLQRPSSPLLTGSLCGERPWTPPFMFSPINEENCNSMKPILSKPSPVTTPLSTIGSSSLIER